MVLLNTQLDNSSDILDKQEQDIHRQRCTVSTSSHSSTSTTSSDAPLIKQASNEECGGVGDVGERREGCKFGWVVGALLSWALSRLSLACSLYYCYVLHKYARREEYSFMAPDYRLWATLIAYHQVAVTFIAFLGFSRPRQDADAGDRWRASLSLLPEGRLFGLLRGWPGEEGGAAEARLVQEALTVVPLVLLLYAALFADLIPKDDTFDTWVPVVTVVAAVASLACTYTASVSHQRSATHTHLSPAAAVAVFLSAFILIGGRTLTLGVVMVACNQYLLGVLCWLGLCALALLCDALTTTPTTPPWPSSVVTTLTLPPTPFTSLATWGKIILVAVFYLCLNIIYILKFQGSILAWRLLYVCVSLQLVGLAMMLLVFQCCSINKRPKAHHKQKSEPLSEE